MNSHNLFKAIDGTVYYIPEEYSFYDFNTDDESIDPYKINEEERMIRWKSATDNNNNNSNLSNQGEDEIHKQFSKYSQIYIVNSVKAGKTSNYELRLKNEIASLYYDVMKRYNTKTNIIKTESADAIFELGVKIKKNWKLSEKKASTLIIILSGDTSISELLNGSTLDPILHILTVPVGTANALFLKLFKLPKEIKLGEDPKQEKRQIMSDSFFRFVCGDLKLINVPFYIISNKQGIELSKSILLTTTGFHATLLKVASSPEYKKYGVERFVKASGEVINNYKLDNNVKLYNSEGKIYYNGESSYFGIFSTGRLEPTYDISPKSDLKNRAFLSIKENGDRKNFVDKIMYGYGDEKVLLENFKKDENIAYENVDLQDELYLEVTNKDPTDPKRDVSICVDGFILNNEDIKDTKSYTYTIKIKTETHSNVRFYTYEKGLYN